MFSRNYRNENKAIIFYKAQKFSDVNSNNHVSLCVRSAFENKCLDLLGNGDVLNLNIKP